MIIRGILDRSLSSQLCIRGFAPIKELARISKADFSYQRNPLENQNEIASHIKEIRTKAKQLQEAAKNVLDELKKRLN